MFLRILKTAFILMVSTQLALAEKPRWDGQDLRVDSGSLSMAVIPLSDDIIRVRIVDGHGFGRDHSYAVVSSHFGVIHAKAETQGDNLAILTTATLKITIQTDPLRLAFSTASGVSLDSDISNWLSEGTYRIVKHLSDDEHIYGLGEKSGRLDKRGWQLGGYNCVMWNSDTYCWDSSTDPLYAAIPFYLAMEHGRAHGIFIDNTARSYFDVGHDAPSELALGGEGKEVNYYFINGPAPKDVISRYTELTGRMPMPPLWSLGYNQCRYSYYPEARVRRLASDFREKRIPADVIWLDIHYQDNYKPFTWNHDRFPDPKSMIADLAAQGFKVVTIVDAHPKIETGYAPFDTGLAGGYFIKDTNGAVYSGKVWPALAETNPAPSVFPDFTQPAARRWWGGLFKGLLDEGVAGIWNDMNEPSVFVPPTGTMALDVMQDNEGDPTTHRQVHNVYGQLMSRATFEGLSALQPNRRAFVLTRSTYAGGQRYGALWTGDAPADWASLRQSISTLLGLGVSGFGFVGADIGGFVHPATAELFTRWLQAGVFYPFMRTHTDLPNPDKEPWSFGARFEAVNKHAIELRYELLPYIYNAVHQMAATGIPAMRPLFVEYPGDEAAAAIDDEFLFGADLLVAPVLWEGATDRAVYLPKGDWLDYWTGKRFEGGRSVDVPAPLESIPVFVRAGGFVFRQPVVQNTEEMAGNSLEVLAAPSDNSTAILYEDDGTTLAYTNSVFLERQFHHTRRAAQEIVEVDNIGGSYVPASRPLELQLWESRAPKSITLAEFTGTEADGQRSLPGKTATGLATAKEGWAWDGAMLVVKAPDYFQHMRFMIEK
ncbi:MAG TPA: TIM-barrel domain-containing protein [Verrucomicrobiae bacterium]|jgi:alpha-glucosidase